MHLFPKSFNTNSVTNICSFILSFIFITITNPFSQYSSLLVQGCGFFEFFSYDELPIDIQRNASIGLRYDNYTWNTPFTNPIEWVSYDTLVMLIGEYQNGTTVSSGEYFRTLADYTYFGGEGDAGEMAMKLMDVLKVLDLYKDATNETMVDVGKCWDYLVNHYVGYKWSELQDMENPLGDNVGYAASILGWNETMWDLAGDLDVPIPETDCLPWYQLSPEEKWALSTLGITGRMWRDFPEDPRCMTNLTVSNHTMDGMM